MKYIAKDKFDCKIEINDQILKVVSKLGPRQHDSNEFSIIKDEIKLEKFSYAGTEDGLLKFNYKKDGKRKSIQVAFKYEQQKRICLVANAIVFSRYKPQDGNPSFTIGLGGSLEIRSNKLVISRYSKFQLFSWARKLESKEFDLQSVRGIGFLKAGMMKESLVQEFGDVGCIRFIVESQTQTQSIWNPLTDSNTILFDKSMELMFYRMFMLMKKLIAVRTIEFEQNSSQFFSYSVHDYLADWEYKHPTRNLKWLTKREIVKLNDEHNGILHKICKKALLIQEEVKELTLSFQEKVKLIGMLYMMTDIKDEELEKIQSMYGRGLLEDDQFERFIMHHLKGYTFEEAREYALKRNEIQEIMKIRLKKGSPWGKLTFSKNEANNSSSNEMEHSVSGKVIQFPVSKRSKMGFGSRFKDLK